MRINLSRFILLLFLSCSCLFMVSSSYAQSAGTPGIPQTCDPDFWEVMDARAWMEGSREMEMAQRLILKPDSVLEYSCFDARKDQLSGGLSFSSGNAISLMISGALSGYLNNNFNHSYGGGTANGGSDCNSMQVVWDALRCHDFDDDKFLTFADLSSADPRDKPIQCPAGNRVSLWNAALSAVYPDPARPPSGGGMEAVINYPALMSKTSCSGVDPIPTGVMVMRGGALVPDAVCPAIGCYFDGSTGCIP